MGKKVVLLLILFIFGCNVEALSFDMDCPSGVKKGDTITIPVYINWNTSESNIQVSMIDGNFIYENSELQFVGYDVFLSGWTKVSQNDRFAFIYMDDGNPITQNNYKAFNAKFNVLANNGTNINLKINNTKATDFARENEQIDNVRGSECNFRVLSDINTLSSITLSSGTIDFNPNTLVYDLTVDTDSITIGATKTDNNSTISGDIGTKTLDYGLNTFKITVTSESGNSLVYTLNITRTDSRSNSNYMTDFEFLGYNLNFNSMDTNYSIIVENDIVQLAVCSEPMEGVLCISNNVKYSSKSNGNMTFNGNIIDLDKLNIDTHCSDNQACEYYYNGDLIGKFVDDTFYLLFPNGEINEGTNTLVITVTAENGEERNYVFTINRKSSNGEVPPIDGSSKNSDKKDDIKNPNTGKLPIYLLIILMVLSLSYGIYYYNKKKAN